MSTPESRTRATNLAILTFTAVTLLLVLVFPASRTWVLEHGSTVAQSITIAFGWLWNDIVMPVVTAVGQLF